MGSASSNPKNVQAWERIIQTIFLSQAALQRKQLALVKRIGFQRELNRNVLSTLPDSGKRAKRNVFHYVPLFLPLCFPGEKEIGKNSTQVALAVELQVFSPIICDRFTRPHSMIKLCFSYPTILKLWSL